MEKGEKVKENIAEQLGIPTKTLSIIKKKIRINFQKEEISTILFSNDRKKLPTCVNNDIDDKCLSRLLWHIIKLFSLRNTNSV